MKTLSLTALLASAVLASAANAQSATPAATPLKQGPAVPGLCVINQDAAIGTSDVGKAMIERMRSLAAAVEAELKPQETKLTADKNALIAAQANTPRDQFETQANAFNQRAAAFERLNQIRAKELEITQQKQLAKIGESLSPAVDEAYQEKGCSVLMERGQLYMVSPAMDITDTAVAKLNTKIKTISFEREKLNIQDAPAASAAKPVAKPAAAPAAKPAAAAPTKK